MTPKEKAKELHNEALVVFKTIIEREVIDIALFISRKVEESCLYSKEEFNNDPSSSEYWLEVINELSIMRKNLYNGSDIDS